jgi:hypothetical protein
VTVFGLHRTVLLLAATHFIVGGYGTSSRRCCR